MPKIDFNKKSHAANLSVGTMCCCGLGEIGDFGTLMDKGGSRRREDWGYYDYHQDTIYSSMKDNPKNLSIIATTVRSQKGVEKELEFRGFKHITTIASQETPRKRIKLWLYQPPKRTKKK